MTPSEITTSNWLTFYDKAKNDGQLIESVIQDFYSSFLSANAIALDGGANVGYHTTGLSHHLENGLVIGVEANRNTFETLQANCNSQFNIKLIYAALQDDHDLSSMLFHCSSSHPGRSGLKKLWDLLTPGEVEYNAPDVVPACTIDNIVKDLSLDRLDFIKLDLEGGEYSALRGGARTISSLRPIIVTEHSHLAPALNDYDLREYFDWIHLLGYKMVSPSGKIVDFSNPYPFWYVFLVPTERQPQVSKHIISIISRYL